MDRSSEDLGRAVERATANPGATLREPLGDRNLCCDQHGPYVSSGVRYMGKREIWTPCPACDEARIAAERHAEAQRRAETARAALETMIGEAAIPARFIGRTLENFNCSTTAQSEALQITREFVEHFSTHRRRGTSLIFSGLPGTGKSHLAAAALQALMPEHCGLYTTCMNVIRAVRGTWRKDSERSESQVLNAYADVPLLVIDEIGVQYGTDGEQTILFDVLDRRYRDMKPSIFLTNQDKKGFKEFIGERTYDRLTETSRWVSFDWPSYRPTARKEAL
ncbi:MAG: ATP-binding protein [Janthinobacterium lividum]